jgi:hypothetical protein
MVSIRQISLCAALLAGLIPAQASVQSQAQAAAAVKKPAAQPRAVAEMRPLGGIVLLRPDLVVSLSSDSRATAGTNILVTVKVTNKGTVKAIGTSEGPVDKAYMVDLVWSADSNIPARTAIQPGYQGLTKDDFVEDMLVLGGRISNTTSIPPGGSVTYNLPAYVPKKTQPGTYWLGAYADSLAHVAESKETNNTTGSKVLVGTLLGSTTTVPAGVDYWVMPWAVGGTPLYSIKGTGLTDYTDGLSGRAMIDAPFGGRLGFRHGYDSRIPTPQLYYYRWQYRPIGGSWQEFSESIGAHYVRKVGMAVSFPVYPLGPKNVGGMNLYEFRPHVPPSEAGADISWPATDWFGDIYSGLLNSTALPEGSYQFKLELYNQSGVKVLPDAATFRFIAPTGTTADGTVNTVQAPAASIEDGGYIFTLHLDNRSCSAVIDAPVLGGGSATDACGFLLYDPAMVATADAAKIRLAFHATHPANFALFSYKVIRATTNVVDLAGEVSAAAAGAFTGDGAGNFSGRLTRTELLDACSLPAGKGKGAFAEVLHVLPKATTGWSQRITAYDAYTVRAFALAPK